MGQNGSPSEKQALLEHTDGESDGIETSDGDTGCCHPGSTKYRYVVLVFLCLAGVGDYFIQDNPAALEDHILVDLDVGVAQYMLFYSVYQWTQLGACLISGYLIDKVFGNRWAMLIGCSIVTVAQVVFGLGAFVNNFLVMCLGRMLFGIVEAAFGIAINNTAVRWFKSKELNLVMALKTSTARMGSVIQMNVMGPIYNFMNRYFHGHTSLAMALYAGAAICVLSALCAVVLFYLDKKGDKYCLNKELLNTTKNDFRLTDIKEFPLTYWLACLVISCYYWSVFTFVGLGVVYFEMKYKQEPSVAANMNSLAYLISIAVMPVSGWMIDKVGRSLNWLFTGLVLGLVSHGLMAFTFINPYVPISILGISYSIVTASTWPMIPYMVELKYCGTGFGIMNPAIFIGRWGMAILMNSVIAIGQSGITYLAGYLIDNHGYLVVEVLFISGICAAIIFTSLIYLIDNSKDGVLNLSVKERNLRLNKAQIVSQPEKAKESQQ